MWVENLYQMSNWVHILVTMKVVVCDLRNHSVTPHRNILQEVEACLPLGFHGRSIFDSFQENCIVAINISDKLPDVITS